MKKPEIRYLDDMRMVLYDKKWAKKAPNFELYYMYRGVKKKRDLRYDITIIPPRMLGKEFPKTKGHYHPKNSKKIFDEAVELYGILNGQAIFLFQKTKNKFIKDVFAIKAKKGEFVVILPEFEHITINPIKKKLILENWIFEKTKSEYSRLEKMKGACYFYTKSGWIKNKNYKFVPKVRFEKPLKEIPKDLEFLKRDVQIFR
jgi:glucose-6-phosphate isomerase